MTFNLGKLFTKRNHTESAAQQPLPQLTPTQWEYLHEAWADLGYDTRAQLARGRPLPKNFCNPPSPEKIDDFLAKMHSVGLV